MEAEVVIIQSLHSRAFRRRIGIGEGPHGRPVLT